MNTLINEVDNKKIVTDLKDETIRFIQQSSSDEAVIKEWTIKNKINMFLVHTVDAAAAHEVI